MKRTALALCFALGMNALADGQQPGTAGPAPYPRVATQPQQGPPQQGPPTRPIRPVSELQPVGGNNNGNNAGNANPNAQPNNVIRPPQGNGNPNNQPQGVPLQQQQQPQGPQLSPAQQKLVNDLLANWQNSTGNILRFQCEFKRWEYDAFGPKPSGPNVPREARTFATGIVAFEAPGKGAFKVDELKAWSGPEKEGEQWSYKSQSGAVLEHWVCDSKSVFAYDYGKKELHEIKLPKEMQGQAIADGPLPFLFGAKVEKMKARYWFVPYEQANRPNEYCLDAYPKLRGDAANYQKVQIILDKTSFLPTSMTLYKPNHDAVKNPDYAVYVFPADKMKTNWNPVLAGLKIWEQNFLSPTLPFGWKKVVDDPGATPPGPPPAGTVPGGSGQAKAPAGTIRK